MAVFFGLVAWLYIEAEHAAAHAFHRIHYLPARTFVGGIVLVLLALAFSRITSGWELRYTNVRCWETVYTGRPFF